LKTDEVDRTKRRFLIAATTVVGAAGLAMATVPFIRSMGPSARSRAANAPVRVNVSKLQPGQQLTVEWRRRPVWILHRSAEMLAALENSLLRRQLRDPDSLQETQQPAYAQNAYRSIKPEYLVVVGICTHLSCVPTLRLEATAAGGGRDRQGGYTCACHGSRFDLAGRVFNGVPAPSNLLVPPHRYLEDRVIECGAHPA
jgi:ubiquinol-cytochrome c reductase iron-sulfur subunit